MKYLKSDGEIQVAVEGVQEHLEHLLGAIRLAGLLKMPAQREECDDYPVGSVGYHALIVSDRLSLIAQSMIKLWGHTDGQLCPYDDCCHDLAISEGGWWHCPNCKRSFWARVSDSDYEDYHFYPAEEAPKEALLIEATGRTARDLGASWATPKDETSA